MLPLLYLHGLSTGDFVPALCQFLGSSAGVSGPVITKLTEQWNPIESTFATVRHHGKVTKGPGSRAAGLAMAFKLIESAQARWRAVNAPTSSPLSAPARPSRKANSSNDPTNQEAA